MGEFLEHCSQSILADGYTFHKLSDCMLRLCFVFHQVRELAEKEPENGVFKMLRSDVTRFLTTILIGTT